MKQEFYSRSYHRFFEGYTEKEERMSDGKKVIRRVYTGTYFLPDVSRRRETAHKFLYLAAYLGAVILFLLCSMNPAEGMRSKAVSFGVSLSILALIYLAIPVFTYLFRPLPMEIRHLRESVFRLRKASGIAAFCLAADALLSAGLSAVYFREDFKSMAVCAAGYLLAAACVGGIFATERKIIYLEQKNEETIPENGTLIKRYSPF